MNRRRVLATGATLSSTLFSGCVAKSVEELAWEVRRIGKTPEPYGPTRGEGPADISTRTVEDDENVSYLPQEDAVRYIAGWQRTNDEEAEHRETSKREPVYETTPFERWGETQCLSAGAQAAATYVQESLSHDDTVRAGVMNIGKDEDRVAFVAVRAVLDRNGDVISNPTIDFPTFVTMTPRSVDVTYALGEQEFEHTVPVYARKRVVQQQ
ncbi:hypothetical protein KU306_02985 [Haloferax larsenii]|uniref:Lipoprotein n=1 Tax=Haloferax larsenii TaxID=302484 RepID=A0ABY5RI94_HALLR|nr:hypothetical protein [Haloferax larsenii]ELZ79478.1 hypothetical protein C455_07837 [Haloferax larsenii JCM 13917]UVE50870.1 hypothetical protein KU306_02985 [Haloferax larsenii]